MRTKITRVGDEEENNSAIEPNIGSSRHCHAGHDPKACMIFFSYNGDNLYKVTEIASIKFLYIF